VLPLAGGMAFSPLIALLRCQILASVILRLLPPAIPNPPF